MAKRKVGRPKLTEDVKEPSASKVFRTIVDELFHRFVRMSPERRNLVARRMYGVYATSVTEYEDPDGIKCMSKEEAFLYRRMADYLVWLNDDQPWTEKKIEDAFQPDQNGR